MAERLFRQQLAREYLLAHRFDESFLLVMVAGATQQSLSQTAWRPVVDLMSGLKRDTDVLGWFRERSLLAMIVPEIGPSSESLGPMLKARLRDGLTRAAASDGSAGFSIRIHRHDATATPEVEPVGTTPFRWALKRALDIVGSATLLVLLLPVFAAVAAAVKLKSPGPVLFRQSRVGEGGKLFTMLKFRTMHVNNDSGIHQAFVSQFIKSGAPTGGDASTDAPFKIVNDPRVTPVGQFLRSSSLDELPQLWNVLRGDMSLVGPRPALEYEVDQYKPWHRRRVTEVKPGMTGLWQVSGRSRTTFDDMVRLDLRYAKRSSAWTDIKILLATPRAVISGKGAC